ncbi:unnamed protein product [Darwinula stevensoni]|uniref:Uncharacterized protein n=1 Tax=Darwinula stevensoni TaxID=69355 RepID=A0A7R9A7S6_9CRUS|nr:unnamed protein product [Darwinula stevensoni]CAG0893260.1 unnamed protein product [Darwinula stevensoni]
MRGLPMVGENCTNTTGCATEYAECAAGTPGNMTCNCKNGYVLVGTECSGGRRGLSGGAIFAIILVVGILASIIGFLVHASIYRPDRVLAIKRRLGIVRPITDRVEYDTL